MYLSHLLIDAGANPDRPRPGRLWLRNVYHVHQRLSMAFPSRSCKEQDPQFVQPYAPERFERPRFLFRIDAGGRDASPSVSILVLSTLAPDWEYAFANAGMLLAGKPQSKEYSPAYRGGDRLRFRIRMNLSEKSGQHRKANGRTDEKGRARTQGKRVALTWEEGQEPAEVIRPWFARKGSACGFGLDCCDLIQLGWVSGYRRCDEKTLRFRAGLLEGVLLVQDAGKFNEAVCRGIGSAKAFGLGLLSVAPV